MVALVRVPDIRIPRPPNFLTARPQPGGAERSLECSWVQAGSPDGIGFVVDHRDAHAFAEPEEGWSPLAEVLPVEVVHGAGGRVKLVVAAHRPGCLLDLRIRAVRHALDPDDPRAIALRRIVGPPSQVLRAAAIGRIAAPADLAASLAADHTLTLTWTNASPCAQLEVQWRAPGRWGYERARVATDASAWSHQPSLAGDWIFRVVAAGWGEQAMSEPLTFAVTGI